MKKLKPIRGRTQGCLLAGAAKNLLPLSSVLAVGFGEVTVTRNGDLIWFGDDIEKSIREFERKALKNPGDWRVTFNAPLYSNTYQRQGDGKWVLVKQGGGFA